MSAYFGYGRLQLGFDRLQLGFDKTSCDRNV